MLCMLPVSAAYSQLADTPADSSKPSEERALLVTQGLQDGGNPASTDTLLLEEESRIDPFRLGIVAGVAASSLGMSYVFVQNQWWGGEKGKLHLDTGNDLIYAKNIDKAAHFFGGLIAADLSYEALRWSGMTEEQALWYGAGFGTFVQIGIELKDGYSPRWGFSLVDVGTGTLGSLFPVAQYYVEPLQNIDIKFSYWQRTRKYFTEIKTDGNGTFNDDYINQTYWASVKVNNFLPQSIEPYYPDWLAFAVGFGVDDKITGWTDESKEGYGEGNIELFLALDVDITALFPSDSPFWESVKHYLNYIKFPAPAVRISPSVIWYGLYF